MEMPTGRRVVCGIAFMAILGLVGFLGQGRIHIGGASKEKSPPKASQQSFLPGSDALSPEKSNQSRPVSISNLVNLNTASAKDFDSLPGIGSKLSQSIIEFRAANGPFTSVEGLRKVPGIGPKVYKKISGRVTL